MPETRDRADEIIERFVGVPVRMTVMLPGRSSLIIDTVLHRVSRRDEGGLIALDGGAFFIESAMLVDVSPTMLASAGHRAPMVAVGAPVGLTCQRSFDRTLAASG